MLLSLLAAISISALIYYSANRSTEKAPPKPKMPFKEVYLINRVARLDRLLPAIALFNFISVPLKVIDAIEMESSVVVKATSMNKASSGETACYSSHINLLRRIVVQNIETALILEDDVMASRAVLPQLMHVTAYMKGLNVTGNMNEGLDWDLLYLGSCGETTSSLTYYSKFSNHYVSPSVQPGCSHAYAVTQKGARLILANIVTNLGEVSMAIDMAYRELIFKKIVNSYSVHPPLFAQNRGLLASDIREVDDQKDPYTLEDIFVI